MATNSGKGKSKKQNKKTIPLSLFQAEDTAAPQGFNVVSTRKIDWAESMEDDLDDTFTLNYKRSDNTKVLLPTAPKSTRGPDIDMSKVPTEPPFKAYIGNLPYDVAQEEIMRYFAKLKIIDVQVPHSNGRQRGFAYAEFPDRQMLIDALALNGDTFKNRPLRIGLAGDNDNARDNNREDRREDRTANNWRSAPREDNFSRDTNRENYGMRNGMNDFPDRSMQRNRNDDFGRRPFESDRGFRSSDRGFDRGFDSRSNNYSNDRSYDRPSDRGFDRPNNRYGNRFNDGPEDNRDFGQDSSERSYGRRFDDSRQQNRSFGDRRSERSENRRDYGFGERRGRDEFDSRNTSPPPSRESEENKPKERPRLQLQPRSKPINNDETSTANSAIFGGAKPVNTALREQQIEEKLLKEREESDKRREPEERVRRISSGSNHSATSRSRKGSESGRDLDDDRRNGSHRGVRSRRTSERSDKSSSDAPKYLMTRNKEPNNSSKIVSVRTEDRDDPDLKSSGRGNGSNRLFNNNINSNTSNKRRDKDREYKPSTEPYRPPRMASRSEDEEERKGPAYTTTNKFAHLPTEDYEDEDGTQNASD